MSADRRIAAQGERVFLASGAPLRVRGYCDGLGVEGSAMFGDCFWLESAAKLLKLI